MQRALIALVSLAATLALLELGTRLLHAWRGVAPPHWDVSLSNEWKWAHAHLEAGSAVLDGPDTWDERLGWLRKPYFRPPHAPRGRVGEARRPGVPRIVLVGDSYTMALRRLGEDFLPDWEVVNLGAAGYGLGQIVLRWEVEGARYRPDVVVLGLYLRDYFRMFDRFRGYAKPVFELADGGEPVLRGSPVIPPEALYREYAEGSRRIGGWRHSYLAGVLGARFGYGLAGRDVDESRWPLLPALLRRFRDGVVDAGARPFLLIFPTRPGRFEGTVFEEIERRARDEAERLGIPSLSLAEVFYREPGAPDPDDLFQSRSEGGHLTDAGVALAIRRLEQALVQAGLAPS